MGMSVVRVALFVVDVFVAVTATGGGIALMAGLKVHAKSLGDHSHSMVKEVSVGLFLSARPSLERAQHLGKHLFGACRQRHRLLLGETGVGDIVAKTVDARDRPNSSMPLVSSSRSSSREARMARSAPSSVAVSAASSSTGTRGAS